MEGFFSDEEVMYEQVVLKIRHAENEVYLLQYILDTEEEVTWLSGSKDTEVFYNDQYDFMVADPDMGIVNLETKEVLHEYHIAKRQADEMKTYDMGWGSRLVQSREGKYLILPNCVLMPYSYLSVVQHF